MELGHLRVAGRRFSERGPSCTLPKSRRRWTRQEVWTRPHSSHAVIPISVDVGVMERSERVRVLSGDFGWDDVGTWGALRRVKPEDASGNVSERRRVHARIRAATSFTRKEAPPCCLAFRTWSSSPARNLTLVTTTDESADLKKLVDSLPARSARDRVKRLYLYRRREGPASSSRSR